MKKELEEKLKADFPNLYKDLWGNSMETCLTNIQTRDGWFELIYDLSRRVEEIVVAMPDDIREKYRLAQCKEKFGTLRFYMTNYTDELTELISGAEQRSAHLCEWCGKSATLKQNSNNWMHTICDTCELLK